jgi:hypothetical protein
MRLSGAAGGLLVPVLPSCGPGHVLRGARPYLVKRMVPVWTCNHCEHCEEGR